MISSWCRPCGPADALDDSSGGVALPVMFSRWSPLGVARVAGLLTPRILRLCPWFVELVKATQVRFNTPLFQPFAPLMSIHHLHQSQNHIPKARIRLDFITLGLDSSLSITFKPYSGVERLVGS
jgi:hypothetical protein